MWRCRSAAVCPSVARPAPPVLHLRSRRRASERLCLPGWPYDSPCFHPVTPKPVAQPVCIHPAKSASSSCVAPGLPLSLPRRRQIMFRESNRGSPCVCRPTVLADVRHRRSHSLPPLQPLDRHVLAEPAPLVSFPARLWRAGFACLYASTTCHAKNTSPQAANRSCRILGRACPQNV